MILGIIIGAAVAGICGLEISFKGGFHVSYGTGAGKKTLF